MSARNNAQGHGLAARLRQLRARHLDLGPENNLIALPDGPALGGLLTLIQAAPMSLFEGLLHRQAAASLVSLDSGGTKNTPLPGDTAEADIHQITVTAGGEVLQAGLDVLAQHGDYFETEAGVAATYLTIGELCYRPKDTTKWVRAPLLLMPAHIFSTDVGRARSLLRLDGKILANRVLIKSCRLRFDMALPDFQESKGFADYFQCLAALQSDLLDIEIETSLGLGVFWQPDLTFHEALNPERRELAGSPLATALFDRHGQDRPAGAEPEPQGSSPAPFLLSADRAQEAVLGAIAQGRNVVVAAPPGCGATQTLANAVAGVLQSGGNVLIVAQKTAALRASCQRLTDIGLEDFVLPLFAGDSHKQCIFNALRQAGSFETSGAERRVELEQQDRPLDEAAQAVTGLRALLRRKIGQSELTLKEVLERARQSQVIAADWPETLIHHDWPDPLAISPARASDLLQLAEAIDLAEQDYRNQGDAWREVGLVSLDPQVLDRIVGRAARCADLLRSEQKLTEAIKAYGLSTLLCEDAAIGAGTLANEIAALGADADAELAQIAQRLDDPEAATYLEKFFAETKDLGTLDWNYRYELLPDVHGETALQDLSEFIELLERFDLPRYSAASLEKNSAGQRVELGKLERAVQHLRGAAETAPVLAGLRPALMVQASNLAAGLPRRIAALRARRFQHLDFHKQIIAGKSRSVEIKLEGEALSRLFHLTADLQGDQLRQCAAVLRQRSLPHFARGLLLDLIIATEEFLATTAGRGKYVLSVMSPSSAGRRRDMFRNFCAGSLLRLTRVSSALKSRFVAGNTKPAKASRLAGFDRGWSRLANTGIFSLLSRDFRAARDFYLRLSRRGYFERGAAIQSLNQLADWLEKRRSFETDAALVNLLGGAFNGGDAQFDDYLLLAIFYKSARRHLADPDARPALAFLQSADAEIMSRLQVFPAELNRLVASADSLAGLEDRLHGLRQKDAAAGQAEARLKELAENPVEPEARSVAAWRAGLHDFGRFRERWTAAEQEPRAREILGPTYFKGANTRAEDSRAAQRLIAFAKGLPDAVGLAVLRAISDGQTQQVTEVLGKVETTRQDLKEEMAVFATATKITLDETGDHYVAEDRISWLQKCAGERKGLEAFSRLAISKKHFTDQRYGFVLEILEDIGRDFGGLRSGMAAIMAEKLAQAASAECRRPLAELQQLDDAALEQRAEAIQSERRLLWRQMAWLEIAGQVTRELAEIEAADSMRGGEASIPTQAEGRVPGSAISHASLPDTLGQKLFALKRVWLLSPTAVCNYLCDRNLEFDLVIFEETSQMLPEMALPALALGRQALIFGDKWQLPPVEFIRATGRGIVDPTALDIPPSSLFDQAASAFAPVLSLNRHHRSKDPRLFAFNNKHFYGDRLAMAAGVQTDAGNMAEPAILTLRVEGRETAGVNDIEARALLDAVAERMRRDPNQSIAIIAIGRAQRDHLRMLFREWAGKDTALGHYLSLWAEKNHGAQAFTIKECGDLQGDVRDVIYISTVAGPENLNRETPSLLAMIAGFMGRQYVNVLFSRGRQHVLTFTSLDGGVKLAVGTFNPGLALLDQWLAHGDPALTATPSPDPT